MKKSEIYQNAMSAVLRSNFPDDTKLEMLAVLMEDKKLALWSEKQAEEKEAEA